MLDLLSERGYITRLQNPESQGLLGEPSGAGPDDSAWMRCALAQAELAAASGDIPVGAVIVAGGRIIGQACNRTECLRDPTAHAEILAIRQATAATGYCRLPGAVLYVTLEPCAMCAGAVVLARIPRLVYGAPDPKAGACGSLRNVVQDGRLNHRCEVVGGVLREECAQQLRVFFAALRAPAS